MENVEMRLLDTDQGTATLITLTNASGGKVCLTSLGAGVVSVVVPDSHGDMADVVARYDKEAARLWDVEVVADNSVKFTSVGHDDSKAEATYVWRDDNTLELYVDGATAPPINATGFNLDGIGVAPVLDNTLWLNVVPVTEPNPMRIDQWHNVDAMAINDYEPGVMQEAAVLASHASGRQINIYATYPSIRVSADEDAVGFSFEPCADAKGATQLVFMEFKSH